MTALILHNARVLTFDRDRPCAEAVAVRDGRIAAVGELAQVSTAVSTDAERFNCRGGALLPAFIDAHCHLLAYAASLRAVDCRTARSIADIQQALRTQAAATLADEWIRAFGYEETSLAENRHPNRHDLDAITPGHPVRLIHGSGHASVLNTAALHALGIDSTSEEPPGGVIEREIPSGEPNGVLLGMERLIDARIPAIAYEELMTGVREAAGAFLRAGVSCIQDAGHHNGRAEWQLFERLIADGALPLSVVLMEGFEHLGELPEHGAGGRLRRGPVKIMLHELGDELSPDEDGLAAQVRTAHEAGRQVAIHAVGPRAVAAATAAIEQALERRPRDEHRHRIEHCSVLPPGLARRLAGLGVIVVSQPSFLRERGERYLQLVPPGEQPALYAFRTLQEAGVTLAAGSDAPVTEPAPLSAVAAAIDRRTAAGRPIAPEQAVVVEDGLRWWTADAAQAAFLEPERGVVRTGRQGDLMLLSADPVSASAGELRRIRVERLWIAGTAVELP